jgi:hypothetical protein
VPQASAPPWPRAICNSHNFREVGLHQCPSERRGENVPVRSLRVPSHVPSHPQTAAKVRGFSPIASGFTAETDWLLEEAGFELVWGFSCQVVVLGFAESSLFGAGKPFFIPSPAIRFPERAEGVKGPKC